MDYFVIGAINKLTKGQIFGSYVIRGHGYFTASVTSQEVTLGGDDVTDTA